MNHATNVGGIPEVLDHEVNGFLYEPDNKASLVKYMISLLDDETLVRTMGQKGRKKVLENFESSRIADKYLNWYQKTLDAL